MQLDCQASWLCCSNKDREIHQIIEDLEQEKLQKLNPGLEWPQLHSAPSVNKTGLRSDSKSVYVMAKGGLHSIIYITIHSPNCALSTTLSLLNT